MATSAEQDDRDDKKDATEAADAPTEEGAESKGEAKAPSEKDDAGEQDEHDEEEAPRKPAAASSKSAGSKGGKGAKRPGAASGKGAGKARPAVQQGSSLGKSMILFVGIIGVLAAGFAILGREEQQVPPTMKWNVGQTVDVEITLVKNDRADLACAAADEIGGKHCAFEAAGKAWSKGDISDDKKLLKPYTTTDRANFVAAGVWSEPALAADKIPASRFSLKCKFKVEGKLKNLAVRWNQTDPWPPNANEWFAGAVSDCKVVP